MPRAYIGIGSNIEPAKNVRRAIHRLAGEARLIGVSTVYCTDALGRSEQPPYFNCVAAIDTEVPPAAVKHDMLHAIEHDLGRVRAADKYAPRTIDLDLIVYGNLVIDAEGVKIPDPEILERPFLAVPLLELAPNLVLPGFRLKIRDVVATLPQGGMKPLTDYSRLLQLELDRSKLVKSRRERSAV
jgi:dihydroneopterin aldolase/2-amino-4-hydroxy-6-hydroxymethyldihydropteridine diphosphokinase